MNLFYRSLDSLVLFVLFLVMAPAVNSQEREGGLNHLQFRLTLKSQHKHAELESLDGAMRLDVPWTWLQGDGKRDGIEDYVSSTGFDEKVTSFPVGPGMLGLHLSSYAIQESGSAQAAAGRDVFLVYDRGTRTLYDGRLYPGLSKRRYREAGCFSALSTRFMVSDIDGDGYADLGVMEEHLRCDVIKTDDVDARTGPFYEQAPLRWYVFRERQWIYRADLDRRFPIRKYRILPLIGLVKTPVDYVKSLYLQEE